MIVMKDKLNPYLFESVTIPEAVKEVVTAEAKGYDPYDAQHMLTQIDKHTQIIGNLLEVLQEKRVLNDEEIVDILQSSIIKFFENPK